MAFFGFGKKEKDKMKTGLEKTRTGFWGSIMNTLTGSVIDDEMYDDLEEKLILADVGGEVAVHLVDKLRDRVRDKGLKTGEQAADALRDIIAEEMTPEAEMALDGKPAVILVMLIPLIYILPQLFVDQTFAVYLAEPVADVFAVTFTAILFTIQFKKILAKLN